MCALHLHLPTYVHTRVECGGCCGTLDGPRSSACVPACLRRRCGVVCVCAQDENQKVKTITALSLAALAEAATPYGIESFDNVLEPLWRGIR